VRFLVRGPFCFSGAGHTAAGPLSSEGVSVQSPEPRRTREEGAEHIRRLRRLCTALPETSEKLSHGEPTFFVGKKVYAMFANNHHNDGHIAVWIPVPPGSQAMLLKSSADRFFMPPYVGVRGWIGIELDRIDDGDLAVHLLEAWRLTAPKKVQERAGITRPRGGDRTL
jgi:hypothetical protein